MFERAIECTWVLGREKTVCFLRKSLFSGLLYACISIVDDLNKRMGRLD